MDKLLLRKICESPNSTCIESLYLELGIVPINILIKSRRINYLHYLANLKESEMLAKMFTAQWNYPVQGDFTLDVKQDMIDLGLEEIRNMSKNSFKRLVKIKTQEYTLNYLLTLKQKQ